MWALYIITGIDIQNSVFIVEKKFGMLHHYVIKSVVSFTSLPIGWYEVVASLPF